jgi:pilus assembly protein FimV
MKKSLLNLLGVAALSYSVHAYSAGVGGINVESALGQSLKAEIELFTTDKAEKASIIARLASVESYRSRGLDYPFSNKFKFAIESHPDGSSFIRVSSVQPVNEPFVSLLVDVNWASGKLQREFTFLLDPPGYQPAKALAAPVETVAPALELSAPLVVNTPDVADVAAPAEGAKGAVTAAMPATVGAQADPVEVHSLKQADAVAKTPSPIDTDGDIKVHRGDSLAKLAVQNAVDGVSLERMMVALYRANAKQFDGKNMNRIKTGKILRMPDEQELAAVTEAAAKQEIHVQVKDWNAYRQQLASAAPQPVTASAPAAASSGKVSSSVVDKSPLVQGNAKEVLKLSKGVAPTEKVVSTGKGAPTQEQKNAAQEDQIAKAKAAEEQRGRAALLEKNLKEMQHLAELKTQAAALLPASTVKAASALGAQSSVASASAVLAVSGVAASSQVNAASAVLPVVRRKPVLVEPSLMDTLLAAEPLYLVGGLAALLGLGGLGFALSRRKASASTASLATDSYDIGSATGRIAVPELSSPDNGDFTKTLVNTDNRLSGAKEDDPISEADLFLSFGRDAQAEEILKEALQVTPNNEAIQIKLLEIYAKNQNKASFEKLAKSLQSSVASSAWQHAQSMGKKLDPKNSLYGSVVEDAESATMQTLSLKNGVEATPTLNQKMDFDITGNHNSANNDAEKTMIFSAADMASAQKAVMDFDVTSTHPSPVANSNMDFDITATHPAEGVPVVALSDMVFDVTATHPGMPAATPAALADDGGMAFSLDFPIEAAVPVAKPVEFNLSDISFDLNDMPADTASTPVSDFNEVATKLDLAKAYQEMGDTVGAREILDEVMREGNAAQRDAAQMLISQLA